MSKTTNIKEERNPTTWLRVKSFDELMKHEKKIVEQIAKVPNGGQLFHIHPFLLLRDIGVELSANAEKEIRQKQSLPVFSKLAYEALKNSEDNQGIQINLHGLFERREQR